jgi:hypothetical protein
MCLTMAVASIWFSFSFRSGSVTFKVGQWQYLIHSAQSSVLDLSKDESGQADDSTETDFG